MKIQQVRQERARATRPLRVSRPLSHVCALLSHLCPQGQVPLFPWHGLPRSSSHSSASPAASSNLRADLCGSPGSLQDPAGGGLRANWTGSPPVCGPAVVSSGMVPAWFMWGFQSQWPDSEGVFEYSPCLETAQPCRGTPRSVLVNRGP